MKGTLWLDDREVRRNYMLKALVVNRFENVNEASSRSLLAQEME